ncbi:hypothetical protein FRB95_002982 [Tulasnella sp. JGI-2019a]|nr:hypothetical protein FRB95_002982 [Tulasnella sp. JGI-2019a]
MITLIGSSPFSHTRRTVLQENITRISPEVASLDALYFHVVECSSGEAKTALRDLQTRERQILDALLLYGDDWSLPSTKASCTSNASPGSTLLYVVPRTGSISPWSSKATDIARMCNLQDSVVRLERGIVFVVTSSSGTTLSPESITKILPLIHDRMTQKVLFAPPQTSDIFVNHELAPLRTIDIISGDAKSKLSIANKDLGLALAEDEVNYLVNAFVSGEHPIGRNPTDAELFMFAQVNSEHCRHKIFNAAWSIDGHPRDASLFQMIRNTEKIIKSAHTISAYSDNAAVLEGSVAPRFGVTAGDESVYGSQQEDMPILVKVETHNHPTAVSPYPGAATGSGGEIRDEGAVGRGSKPKAGLAGFTVSNLLIPGFEQPWETDFGRPAHIASALDIMTEGPLGASAFNNEFGRPALAGYFRTFAEQVPSSSSTPGSSEIRGYHKPIMIAGGLGNVRPEMAQKKGFGPGSKVIVLGGPGMLIGLGGGAASSQTSGASSADLDFASVQRENPEMQRRCQQVIDACISMGANNPILSIHDVGAGGLSNALPELVHDTGLGAIFEIRDVLVDDTSMSPMEIWCNESQERYVLAVAPGSSGLDVFERIAKRERCPYSVVGHATEEQELIVTDRTLGKDVIRLQMSMLFGKPPKLTKSDVTPRPTQIPFDASLATYLPSLPNFTDRLSNAVGRVLRLPSVGSKSFLITIGDRSITGLVTRDQMVGPWQVPVADVAVTRSSYGFEDVLSGEAMAMGERTPVALLDAAASARMAVAESLTNLAASSVDSLSRVKLSANWMCAGSHLGEGARLYEAVQAVGMELCPALGVGIPVGKDSMSMSMKWKGEDGEAKQVTAPLSLIVTAFAPVNDVRRTWTPQLVREPNGTTVLVFVDLAKGKQRLGGSALAQVYKQLGSEPPNVEDPTLIKSFFSSCQILKKEYPGVVLAYHDRSDGGLLATVVEMCFAGRVGADITLDALPSSNISGPTSSAEADAIASLFNEELGAVFQVQLELLPHFTGAFVRGGFPTSAIHVIGTVKATPGDELIRVTHRSQMVFEAQRRDLQYAWSDTSNRMQALRDDPTCAAEEYALIGENSRGISYNLAFSVPSPTTISSYIALKRPKVAILREQGVNGHVEMAWAFHAAGFAAVDVHMSDLLSGAVSLSSFRGLAACGGFSYGDVLGAGNGWAKSILLHHLARDELKQFFERQDTFALAVCNGCQLFSHLKEIIPGTENWPLFKQNRSQRFEARVCMVEIVPGVATNKSVFLREMVGSKIPVAVAHGEGRALFVRDGQQSTLENKGLLAVRYTDYDGVPTEHYPLNPNGSPMGITGVQTSDGRVLALMPHPERVVTSESNSWYPSEEGDQWKGVGPWFKLFQSARVWCS